MSNYEELDLVDEILRDCKHVTFMQVHRNIPAIQKCWLNVLEELKQRYFENKA